MAREKYTEAELKVVAFEAEDIITASDSNISADSSKADITVPDDDE